MTIYRIARYTVRPEELEACKSVISQTVAQTQDEPGTLIYMALQEMGSPTSLLHFSAYRDEAALASHIKGEPMATLFREILHPAMVEPATFVQYTLVDAKSPH